MLRHAAALSGLLMLGASAAAADGARYTATFDGTWSAATHPFEYPAGAHFSGLIGATHDGRFTLFKDGGTATAGLERLSEMGAHSPFDEEIRAAKKDRTVGALIETSPIFGPPGKVSVTFDADDRHPLVSLAAMIAPSPDWFTGVSAVALKEGGGWVGKKTLTLYAWDAGTDNGTTYRAPDEDAMPRGQVRLNAAKHFLAADGKMMPVGTITFQRVAE